MQLVIADRRSALNLGAHPDVGCHYKRHTRGVKVINYLTFIRGSEWWDTIVNGLGLGLG